MLKLGDTGENVIDGFLAFASNIGNGGELDDLILESYPSMRISFFVHANHKWNLT